MNQKAINYFLAASKGYKKLHDLPFLGNEDYWTGRIYAYHLMGDLHELENSFNKLKNNEKIPLDIYLEIKNRLNSSKSKIKRWLISVPSLNKKLPEEEFVDVFEKIEKINKI